MLHLKAGGGGGGGTAIGGGIGTPSIGLPTGAGPVLPPTETGGGGGGNF